MKLEEAVKNISTVSNKFGENWNFNSTEDDLVFLCKLQNIIDNKIMKGF